MSKLEWILVSLVLVLVLGCTSTSKVAVRSTYKPLSPEDTAVTAEFTMEIK